MKPDDRLRRAATDGTTLESGTTLVEVLAALTIVSVIGAVLWLAAGAAGDGLRRAMGVRRAAVELLELHRMLGDYAERVRPAYWLGERAQEEFEVEATAVRLGYLDGHSDAWVRIAVSKDGRLEISAADGGFRRFERLAPVSFDLHLTEGIAYGVEVVVRTIPAQRQLDRATEEVRLSALFGATTVLASDSTTRGTR